MAEPKKTVPQRFSADLFSSPSSSSGLSFGLDANFSSPFSLVAATKKEEGNLQVPESTSVSSSQRSSPAPGSVNEYPPARPSPHKDDENDSSELRTVPLDSPVGPSDPPATSPSTVPILRSATDSVLTSQTKKPATREYEYGWNDPPAVYDTPNRPAGSRAMTTPGGSLQYSAAPPGNIQIQPLANHSEINSSDMPPPPASLAEGGVTAANPYRIGTGVGSRKPAYGTSGIASFSSAPSAVSSVPQIPPAGLQPTQQPAPAFQTNVGPSGVPPSGVPPSGLPTSGSASSTSDSMWSEQTDGSRWAPLRHHWFYLRAQENYWIPFSLVDSAVLESALLNNSDTSLQVLIPTDGGRYDVDLHARRRRAVYWEEPESLVRRCTWFYKADTDRWYLPYDELTAQRLEEAYQTAVSQMTWNSRVELQGGECVVMHSHSSIVHYVHPSSSSLSSMDMEGSHSYPKAVMRGFAEIDKVETGEQTRVDHLVFFVHGIGAHHDLSFRRLVDCVDDFREVSQLMLKTHTFSRQAPCNGDEGGRVEFLPVHWHSKLHTSGVDDLLKPLTLPSISRLRDFTNSTLLDILYFTSPLFCQTIVSEVATEMNRMYEIFKARNPSFQGDVSVVGHSLGSVILFDLLYHQQVDSEPQASTATLTSEQQTSQSEATSDTPGTEGEGVAEEEEEPDGCGLTVEEVLAQLGLEKLVGTFQKEQIDLESLLMCCNEDLKELEIGMGPRKKLSSFIAQENEKRQLAKERKAKEAAERLEQERKAAVKETTDAVTSTHSMTKVFGVKIIQGLAGTGQTFVDYPQLLFHPQHLFALGSPIGLFLTVRGVEELGPEFSLPTCGSVFNIFHPFDPVAYRMEPLIVDTAPERACLVPHHKGRKRFHLELYENLGYVGASIKHHLVEGMRNMWQQLNDLARSHTSSLPSSEQQEQSQVVEDKSASSAADVVDSAPSEEVVPIGMLNKGRRVDHVLQEKPIEKLNEYLFALSSHLCYWHSEDTALFILKEVYQEQNPTLIKS